MKRFKINDTSLTSTPMEFGLKLSKYTYENEVNSSIYRSMVGSLMYLMATRPDVMFSVSMISLFMECPKKSHWEAGKRILIYVKGTNDHRIHTKG